MSSLRIRSLIAGVLAASTSCGDNHAATDAASDSSPGEAILHIDLGSGELGSVTLGDASPAATFTISNTGTVPSGSISATFTSTFQGDAASFSVGRNDCTTLAPAATCQIAVVFTPASAGAKAVTVAISANPGGTVTASLTGRGVARGALSIAANVNMLGSAVVGKVGTTTATFTVTNTGGTPTGAITIQPTGSDPEEFRTSADTCVGQTLAAADSCSFVAQFSPMSVGAKSALFEVTADPGGSVSGAVDALGLAPAHLVAQAVERNLGSVIVGQPNGLQLGQVQRNPRPPDAAVAIIVTNVGDVSSDTLVATLSGTDAASFSFTGCDGSALGPKASCTLTVHLVPLTIGAKSAQLTIAGAPDVSVDTLLTGVGIVAEQLGIDRTTATFSNTKIGETSATETFTIVNSGADTSSPLTTVLGGLQPSQFHTVSDTCTGTSLAPSAQCTIGVEFRPSVGGPASAELAVASTEAGVVTAGLFGEAVAAAQLAIAPSSKGFGSVAIGMPTAAHTFTITNPGGEVSGALTVALVGADASQFAIVDHDCTALAPATTCSVHVQFAPTTIAVADAALEVTAAPGGTVAAPLAGDGVSSDQIVIIPSSFTFGGTTLVGDTAAVRMFTVHNLGTSSTGALAVTTAGADAADHTVTSDCTTLNARGVCEITTAFHPSATGSRDATITVAGAPGGTATTVISGTARPRLEIVALGGGSVVDPFDYGTAVINTGASHDALVTVRNNTASERPLSVTGSAEFSLRENTCSATDTIAAGGTCTVRVRFTPTTVGPRTGSVTFAIDTGAVNEAVQQLSGTGIESLTIAAITSASFGDVPRNTTSAARSFRITNTYGSAVSGPIAVTLSGAGFQVVSDTCATQALIANASCLVDVTFAATENGPATAVLTATASPGGAPSLQLTANGVDPIGSAPSAITLTPSSVAENQPLGTTVGVLAAVDSDVGDAFAFSLVAGPGSTNNASFVIAGNELRTADQFDFEVQNSYSIRVLVTDSGGMQLEQALAIAITNVDEPPTATADAFSVLEDSGTTVLDVLRNDVDADGGPMTITSVTPPAHGSVVSINGDTAVTYRPADDYFGTDSFTYTLNGGSTATVSITVTAVDDPPIALADAASVLEDSDPTVIDVLDNDLDVDGGPKTIASTTDPANGVVAIAPDGLSLTYAPQSGYCNDPPGTTLDSFSYTLAPGGGVGTVTVTVTCQPPPATQSVSPTTGPTEGGTLVTIAGTALSHATSVKFGPNSGAIVGNTATAITVTTPPGAQGSADVTVTTPSGSTTVVGGFTYTLSQTEWTAIGPSPIPNGQTQQSPATAPVSGRVTAIAVDPTNSNKVYLGAASGGVWRSLDGGATWVPIFDTAQSLAVGALALAPSNPTILYVGTGEANNSTDSFFGVGVYRIDNVDTTATLVGPFNPSFTFTTGTTPVTTTCFGGRSISRIIVNPTDPATIYVATTAGVAGIAGNARSNLAAPLGLRGVYRSTNATAAAGAVAFSKLTVNTDGSLDSPGTGNTSIFDMALEPGNANNLLVTTSGASTGGAVYRSTNALAATPTFAQTLFPGFNGLVMRLAINKVGSTVTVYVSSNEPSNVSACSTAGQAGRVRKSVDGGVTWGAPIAAAEGFCGNQCSYNDVIGVDPNDASIVYLGGSVRGTCSDVMKRSADGGATFTRDDTGLFRDSHAFFFDPLTTPTTVWTGNDGGIAKRQDAVAGTAWSNQNTSPLDTVQFQSIAVHPTDAHFTLGGTQSNGTVAQRTSSGNWIAAEGNNGGFALIDQSSIGTDNVTMYHTTSAATNGSIGFFRTNLSACLDVKDSWAFRGAGVTTSSTPSCDGTAVSATNGISVADTVLSYPPMALGPGTPNTLYFGTNKLYRSTDKGDTMTAVSQVLVSGVAISAIGISPQNDNVRIVGTRDGNVFATTTGASTLTNTAFPFPTNATASASNRHVSRAVIDPVQVNTAYITLAYYTSVATAGQVWRTTNLNAALPTWTSISSGLPNVPINGFVADANDPTFAGVTVLYVGTDIGVYRSSDAGVSWAAFGLGLPRTPVFDMAIQPSHRILRVATHGRGMWEIQLPTAP